MKLTGSLIRALRADVSGLVAGVIAFSFLVARPALADTPSQDFDAWPALATWTNYTGADGWAISDGRVGGSKPLSSHSLPNGGWLADCTVSTNSWIQSPLQPYGVALVEYWCKAGAYSYGTNYLAVQYSSNGTIWVTAATGVVSDHLAWQSRQNSVNTVDPVYVRFLKTGQDGASMLLGLDDISMTEPPGVLLSGLQHSPASPNTDDSVDISVNAMVRSGMSNVQFNAMYRANGESSFLAQPMTFVSGSLYRTASPITPGIGNLGVVEYYVQVTCSGRGPSVLFAPEGGSNAPASYQPQSLYALAATRPLERAVFQRDALNYGTIPVAGTYSGTIDGIEARAVPLPGFPGTASAWTAIGFGGGQFSGSLKVRGGWYEIEVRAIRNSVVVDVTIVEKVGVGEVFVTAGQSNAANHGSPIQYAIDERISAYNPASGTWQHADDPQPGATGTGGSPWPAFGDAMVDEFDVPVGILSCAVGGTMVSQWLPGGTCYPGISNALAATVTNGGVRAILWHQGESDSLAGTLATNYTAMLQTIIAQSRLDAGCTVPWGVALVSYIPGASTSNQALVIEGQEAVISNTAHVFRGAQTDSFHLLGYLYDTVHFNTDGLTDHGQQWAECVRSNFFPQPSGEVAITNVVLGAGGGISVGWEGDSNVTFQLQSRTNLLSGSWTNVGEWAVGAGGRLVITNSSDVSRFYRVVAPHSGM